jgi:sarcosine oxidase
VIREAYFEHPLYVPIVQRAYELWSELERETGEHLLTFTGGLMIGPREGVLVAGALRSAAEHRLRYEELSADEVRARFPLLDVPPEFTGVYEPRAGFLDPEKAVAATLALARAAGAELRFGERVIACDFDADGVRVRTTTDGYRARVLVLAAGAWMGELIEIEPRLTVARQPLLWFEPLARHELFDPSRFPIFMWEAEPDLIFYGFPKDECGVKVARHHHGRVTTPDGVNRRLEPEDEEVVRRFLSRAIPDANGSRVDAAICIYTNTPDGNFVIDRLPADERVVIVSACSGHGFKFAPAIGEIVSDLIVDGSSRFDLTPFALGSRA